MNNWWQITMIDNDDSIDDSIDDIKKMVDNDDKSSWIYMNKIK